MKVIRWVMLALLSTCTTVDPNKGRFSCASDADCGEGYACKPQTAGGGRCFKPAECTDERCNGLDDDCDGVVDDEPSDTRGPCSTGQPGVCGPGALLCLSGQRMCQGSVPITMERCNSLDDDCDGQVDEDFMLDTDSANCGSCGRVCTAGSQCVAGLCGESACDDGQDNDGDQLVDCADIHCRNVVCADGGSTCTRAIDGGVDAGFTCLLRERACADSLDNDQDGLADCLDDDCAGASCGDGGRQCGLGVSTSSSDAGVVLGCFVRERVCGDGVDDDADGVTDCRDPDCDGQLCGAGRVCAAGVCP